MIQFKENARTYGRKDGRTDPILQEPSGYRRGSIKIFILRPEKEIELKLRLSCLYKCMKLL